MISELTKRLFDTLDVSEPEVVNMFPGENGLSLRSRRETLRRFKAQWDGSGPWDECYLEWLKTDPAGQREEQGRSYPSVSEQAKSFGKEVSKYLINGRPKVSEKEWKRRLEICESCPDFNAEKRRCYACGCYMEVKAGWSTTKCKKGLW